MNDNAMMALGAGKSPLGGLPQRLVQDGLIDEATMMDAMAAAKEKTRQRGHPTGQQRRRQCARDRHRGRPRVRRAAARPRRRRPRPGRRSSSVDDKLLQQAPGPAAAAARQAAVPRRLRPDQPAGHRRDQVPDRPAHRSGRRRAGQARAGRQPSAIEAVDTSMSQLRPRTTSTSRTSRSSAGDEELAATTSRRDDVEDAPIVRFVNKVMLDAIKKGASDIHFEPYEKTFRIRYAPGRRAEGGRACRRCSSRRRSRRA